MNVAVVTAMGAFAALWATPVLLTRGKSMSAGGQARLGWLLMLYGGCFATAAWWWGVPLEAQKSVRDLASSADPSSVGVGCRELTRSASQFERASNGQLEFRADGSVMIDSSSWKAMSVEQREAFSQFAATVAECAGSASSAGVAVRDIVTGARLDDEQP